MQIAQPLEHHVGVRRITARYLRNRNARSRRLQADRPLLFVRPKPLCPTRHARTIVSTIYSGHYLPRSPRGRAVRPDAYRFCGTGTLWAASPLDPSALASFSGGISLVAHRLAHGLVIKNAGDPFVLGRLSGVSLRRGGFGNRRLALTGLRFQTSLFLALCPVARRLAGFPCFGNLDALLLARLAERLRRFLRGPIGLEKGDFCVHGRAAAVGEFGLFRGSQIFVPDSLR